MLMLNVDVLFLCSTYPTSYEALVGRAQTKAGEWVLVHAAAGGVGMAAVQIAKGMFLLRHT
jgi:NADPH:quinone reductase-like Zn-dependent oxidoreductase